MSTIEDLLAGDGGAAARVELAALRAKLEATKARLALAEAVLAHLSRRKRSAGETGPPRPGTIDDDLASWERAAAREPL